MEANQVLRSIMSALTASNTLVNEEIVCSTQDEEEAPPVGGSGLQKPGGSGLQKPIENTGTEAPILPGEEKQKVKFNKENVCHFFAMNKCKFGKDCRKDHPKTCLKFKKFGLAKFNRNNGCSENCEH